MISGSKIGRGGDKISLIFSEVRPNKCLKAPSKFSVSFGALLNLLTLSSVTAAATFCLMI